LQYHRHMHIIGIAMFLYAASVMTVPTQAVFLPPPPPVASPDHAPPHPLKPRVPPEESLTRASLLARALAAAVKAASGNH
jgi:hypothetical protein